VTDASWPAPDPSTRDDTPDGVRRAPRGRRRVVLGAVAVGLVLATAVTTFVVRENWSDAEYDRTLGALRDAATDHDRAVSERNSLESAIDAVLVVADETAAATDPAYVGASEWSAFGADLAAVRAIDGDERGERVGEIDEARPGDAQGRFEAAEAFARRTEEISADTGAEEARRDAARPLVTALSEANEALYASAATTAERIVAENPLATHGSVLFMREVIDYYGDTAQGMTEYVAAAKSVQASHAAASAERTESDWPVKAEIIEYMSSISGGIPLDVSWHATLTIDGEPYGAGGSGAGLASWETRWGGLGTIQLTQSIADYWPAAWTRGLVTHEVGHAITSKCLELYEAAPFDGDDEMWATAWALSHGLEDGTGTEPYGRPSDEAVALAATCR
jgi:hypothetical protein